MSVNAIPGSLDELQYARACAAPEAVAYRYIADKQDHVASYTNLELRLKAQGIANRLAEYAGAGDRALMLFPPSIEFIPAFFACMQLGVIAVPAYPPKKNRNQHRLLAIVRDCSPCVILSTSDIIEAAAPLLASLGLNHLEWLATDGLSADKILRQTRTVQAAQTAFMQYTSGSTGEPKGVMVSHANLLHNLGDVLQQSRCHDQRDHLVSWLPAFHDMGLIGGILHAVQGGFPATLMSPVAFTQSPLLWLRTISEVGGTSSYAPNFAYDFCVDLATDEDVAALDLSTWKSAYNGAEPIRESTLQRFAEKFKASGFSKDAFYPSYGMAEATLMISGGKRRDYKELTCLYADSEAILQNKLLFVDRQSDKAYPLVGCGQLWGDIRVRVVNPDSKVTCNDNEIGEIWTSSRSVAQGYWNKPEETAATFNAYTADTREGPYLRTGDLGFIKDGEIFITGRHKDLVIIRGCNHYPQDIEHTVEKSHQALRPSCGAAFSIDVNGEEKLVVVHEVERTVLRSLDTAEVNRCISEAVTREHDIRVHGIVLINPASIHKTSSGKIQRRSCKAAFMRGELSVVSSLLQRETATTIKKISLTRKELESLSRKERLEKIQTCLRYCIAALLNAEVAEVGLHTSFNALGLDSLLITQLVSRIRDGLQVEVPLLYAFDAEGIESLAHYIESAMFEAAVTPPMAITPVARQGELPLSFAQQRLWFIDQYEENQTTYNLPAALRINGRINEKALCDAVNEIIKRHESLRTVFKSIDGKPHQVILKELILEIVQQDLSGHGVVVQHEMLMSLIIDEAKIAFDLQKGPLVRVRLIKLGDDDYVLQFTMHHIIGDGWSLMAVFPQELAKIYQAFSSNRPSPLAALPVQYVDYAHWQREYFKGDVLDKELSYWLHEFAGDIPLLELPSDHPRPAIQTYKGACFSFHLDDEIYNGLKQLSRTTDSTLFMCLLAGFTVLVHRYSNQTKFNIGTPIANRVRQEIEGLIGFFVNMLALRMDVTGSPSYLDVLDRVRKTTLGAYSHQMLPFERLVDELGLSRDLSHSPVVQTVFIMQNAPVDKLPLEDLSITPLAPIRHTSKFDLTVDIFVDPSGLVGVVEYSTDLFEEATVRKLISHYENLLREIIAAPEKNIADYRMISDEEYIEQAVLWNNTGVSYPLKDFCLHGLLEYQAQISPASTALVSSNTKFTYRELLSASAQIAQQLITIGVAPNRLVAVVMEKGWEQVVAVFAILQSGAAYLPIDPHLPAERITYLLEHGDVEIALTQSRLQKSVAWPENIHRINVDQAADVNVVTIPPLRTHNNKDLAYVIFTSGSTGMPKGVMITHEAAVNTILDINNKYSVTSKDKVLAISALNFDLSVYDIFGTIAAGGTIVMPDAQDIRDPSAWNSWIATENVTIFNSVPALMQLLINHVTDNTAQLHESLRLVMMSGDWIPLDLPRQIRQAKANIEIISMGGATEASIWSNYFRVEQVEPQWKSIPYGYPLGNQHFYVLNEAMQLCPALVAGELYIGGIGVAQGYWKDEERTRNSFVHHPVTGEYLYRTGDMGRYTPAGYMEFLGRKDSQVKVQGFRVELGEIESAILKNKNVREALATINSDANGKHIVAYVVNHSNYLDDENKIKAESEEQVIEWQELWNETYGRINSDENSNVEEFDHEFNITGWTSSYTGEPIPANEMQQWVNSTISRIMELSPERILEIGCGTGLLLFKLAPQCKYYYGTDLSKAVLDSIGAHINNDDRLRDIVALNNVPAHKIDEVSEQQVDVVVINSVIQYFPSVNYLLSVLDSAIKSIGQKGHIYIGDVLNYALLHAAHTSYESYGLDEESECIELKKKIEKRYSKEEELTLHPNFFKALRYRYAQISDVKIKLKNADNNNELTCYRYDVVIAIGGAAVSREKIDSRPWHEFDGDMAALVDYMQLARPDAMVLRGVGNARVQKSIAMEEIISSERMPAKYKSLVQAVNRQQYDGIDPRQFHALAKAHEYHVDICWLGGEGGADGKYDVVFYKNNVNHLAISEAVAHDESWYSYANNPLQSKVARKLIPELRNELKARLPEYMVPASFVIMDAFPLTENGKVDRRVLPAPEQRQLDTQFVEAQSDHEMLLAAIWRDVLGLEKIGIEDNFFELGGDSILSIQVVSRANKQGLKIRPNHLFQYQTIKDIVNNVDLGAQLEKYSGSVEGEVALTPIQNWFFECALDSAEYWNQALCINVAKDLSSNLIHQALNAVIDRHDALRLRFEKKTDGWKQWYGRSCKSLDFDIVDQDQPSHSAQEMHTGMSLSSGPLVKARHIKCGGNADDGYNKLIISIHHLVVDGVSWRIIIDDLTLAIGQLLSGSEISLGRSSSSYKQWSEALLKYAGSEAINAERGAWQRRSSVPVNALPRDYDADNNEASTVHQRITINSDQTQTLLTRINDVLCMHMGEALTMALAIAVSVWSRHDKVLLDVEAHGREIIDANLDLSQSVGWFTSLYQVALDTKGDDYSSVVKSIKNQLCSIKNHGIAYGILRYLKNNEHDSNADSEIPGKNNSDISFNYLGQLDSLVEGNPYFTINADSFSAQRSGDALRTHLLDINALVTGRELIVDIAYSKNIHSEATLQRLSSLIEQQIEALVQMCKSSEAYIRTPEDFDNAITDQQALDLLVAKHGRIDALYPLSLMQEGILNHSLNVEGVDNYMMQIKFDMTGINKRAYQQAWQRAVNKHEVMRSRFSYNHMNKPLQIILSRDVVTIEHVDYSTLAADKANENIQGLMLSNQCRRIRFDEVPAFNLFWIERPEGKTSFVISLHHLLLDGWSIFLLLNEVTKLYKHSLDNVTSNSSEVKKIQEYVKHRSRQNYSEGMKFWTDYLADYKNARPLRFIRHSDQNKTHRSESADITIDVALFNKLNQFVKHNHLTINTVFQSLWGLVLIKYTGSTDALFGTTVSDRPPEIDGIEDMVGMMINTIPVGVSVKERKTIREWMKDGHQRQMRVREYENVPLQHIQESAGANHRRSNNESALFDSIYVYENYPVNQSIEVDGEIEIRNVSSLYGTNYAINFVVIPAETIEMKLIFDASRVDVKIVDEIQQYLVAMLKRAVEHGESHVDDLLNMSSDDNYSVIRSVKNSDFTVMVEDNTKDDIEDLIDDLLDANNV